MMPSSEEDVNKAVESAKEAFKCWSSRSSVERASVIRKAAEIMKVIFTNYSLLILVVLLFSRLSFHLSVQSNISQETFTKQIPSYAYFFQ